MTTRATDTPPPIRFEHHYIDATPAAEIVLSLLNTQNSLLREVRDLIDDMRTQYIRVMAGAAPIKIAFVAPTSLFDPAAFTAEGGSK